MQLAICNRSRWPAHCALLKCANNPLWVRNFLFQSVFLYEYTILYQVSRGGEKEVHDNMVMVRARREPVLALDEAITCDVCIFNGDVEQGITMIDETEHATEPGCAEDSRQARFFLAGVPFFFFIQKEVQIPTRGRGSKKKKRKNIFPVSTGLCVNGITC